MSNIPIFMKNIYVPVRLFFENYVINFADNKDISQIDDNIFIGNISTATNKEILQEKGITHVIDILSHKFEPYPDDFKYLFVHAYDTLDWSLTYSLPITNLFIRDVINSGGKVYVHCMAGVSRSVSVVLAYMMSLSEAHIDILLNKIKESRPIAQPNTEFMCQLVSFRDNVNYTNALKQQYYTSRNELYLRPPPENPYFLKENADLDDDADLDDAQRDD